MANEDAPFSSESREEAKEIPVEELAFKQNQLAMLEVFRRVQRARGESFEERRDLAFDTVDEVLNALLDNEETTEDELKVIARRRDVNVEILRRLAADKRTLSSLTVKRFLILNPKLPASAGLKLVSQIYLFDLVMVLTTPALPTEVKTAAENAILQQYGGIPLGYKITMARRANGARLLPMMLNDPSAEVVRAALDNPFLTEGLIATAIRKASHGHVVSLIGDSPRWSSRKEVKMMLLRSRYLSAGRATTLIRTLTPTEIRDLQNDPTVPQAVRALIGQVGSRLQSRK